MPKILIDLLPAKSHFHATIKIASKLKKGGYWDPEMGWVLDTVNVYGGMEVTEHCNYCSVVETAPSGIGGGGGSEGGYRCVTGWLHYFGFHEAGTSRDTTYY